ncbi:MAG: peptidoglycan recognition family protein, partial [Planctomycetia bacterium]|nr:peptidoglycan recognition family protein [Planctomycetia bacterium]
SALIFGRFHRENRRCDELGYHFVIGNGFGSNDGQIEAGSRWRKQKHGAHCKVPMHDEYNQVGIGICLVGDFTRSRPTAKQKKALAELVRWLVWRYRIRNSRVIRHSDVKDTVCPGSGFPFDDFHRDVFGKVQ